jgi:hypothetical protein
MSSSLREVIGRPEALSINPYPFAVHETPFGYVIVRKNLRASDYCMNSTLPDVSICLNVWIIEMKSFILEHIQDLDIIEVVLIPSWLLLLEIMYDSRMETGTGVPEAWIFLF